MRDIVIFGLLAVNVCVHCLKGGVFYTVRVVW